MFGLLRLESLATAWARRACAVCCALSGFALVGEARAEARVHLLLPELRGVYQNLAAELEIRLQASKLALDVSTGCRPPGPLAEGSLWLAAGPQCLQALLERRPAAAVLSLLNSREQVQALVARTPPSAAFSALYHDPEPGRQLRLAKQLLPGLRRIGVLRRKGSAVELGPLRREARALDLVLVEKSVAGPDKLLPALEDLLAHSDAVLALPDPAVLNRASLKTVLLTAYRHQRVLFGSSEAMVAVGSLATTHATAAQTAEQAALWIVEALPRRPLALPEPEYTRAFTVSVNRQVARSLGLRLPETAQIQLSLQAAERAAQVGAPAP